MALVAISLWTYDVLLTIGDELELLWSRNGALVKILYLIVRFLKLIDYICSYVVSVGISPSLEPPSSEWVRNSVNGCGLDADILQLYFLLGSPRRLRESASSPTRPLPAHCPTLVAKFTGQSSISACSFNTLSLQVGLYTTSGGRVLTRQAIFILRLCAIYCMSPRIRRFLMLCLGIHIVAMIVVYTSAQIAINRTSLTMYTSSLAHPFQHS